MDRLSTARQMMGNINYEGGQLLDIKIKHMLDEINIYILEKDNQNCWELKFEIIGRVIYTTDAFDVDVELNRPYRDKPLKEIDNIENKFNLDYYRPGREIHISEFDSRLLQIYFNFNALRMTITFKEISVRQCNPDELDLYMLNKNK